MDDNTQPMGQVQEPYGASLLRQFHQDCSCLLMEYDAQLAPLDNPAVRDYMMEVMKLLTRQVLTGAEKVFKKTYKELPPLAEEQAPMEEAPPEEDVQVEMTPEETPPEFGEETMPEKPISGEDELDQMSKSLDGLGSNALGQKGRVVILPRSGEESAIPPPKDRVHKQGDHHDVRRQARPLEQGLPLDDSRRSRFASTRSERAASNQALADEDVRQRRLASQREQTAEEEFENSPIPPIVEPNPEPPHKRMDGMGDEMGLPPDSRNRIEPTPDEVVAGMQTKQKSILFSITPLGGGKGFRVEERHGKSLRRADLTVKGLNRYLTRFTGNGAKSLLDGLAKNLNAGRGVKFALSKFFGPQPHQLILRNATNKSLCMNCKCDPCGCTKSMNGKSHHANVLAPGEQVDGEALHQGKAMPGSKEWKEEEANEAAHNRQISLFSEQDQNALKLSRDFLTQIQDVTDFGDDKRLESYHLHKLLNGVYQKATHPMDIAREVAIERAGGTRASSGTPEERQQAHEDMIRPEEPRNTEFEKPQRIVENSGRLLTAFDPEHLKSFGQCSEFLKMLSREKAFGDPHRREASHHVKTLEGLLSSFGKDLEQVEEKDAFELGAMEEKDLKVLQEQAETQQKQLDGLAKLFQLR